jgi:LysR family transcriptional regulator, transcriptional activator of nhaA
VKEGGVTRASRRLHVTQPTVSSQIRELEEMLGESLLVRDSKKLALTEAGQIVFRHADKIFELGHDMVEEVRGRPTGKPVEMTVGLVNSVPKLLAHRLLQPVLGSAEVTRLSCFEDRFENLLESLSDHQLDLVLSDAPLSPHRGQRVYNHLLGESSVYFFGTERLVTRFRRGMPGSLNGAPMLLPTPNTALRHSLDRWFTERAVTPHVVGEFEDPALMKVFGESGVGIFPALAAVEADIRRLCDVRVLGTANGLVERFYAISTERRIKHPGVAAITEGARHRLLA